jgi:hypothetical protein
MKDAEHAQAKNSFHEERRQKDRSKRSLNFLIAQFARHLSESFALNTVESVLLMLQVHRKKPVLSEAHRSVKQWQDPKSKKPIDRRHVRMLLV